MERTFKEELDFAKEHKIDILKLNIANEVCCQLRESKWWFESEIECNYKPTICLFEEVCEMVWHIYLKVDVSYSLANIVESIINLVFEQKIAVKDINKYMVIEYIQDNL